MNAMKTLKIVALASLAVVGLHLLVAPELDDLAIEAAASDSAAHRVPPPASIMTAQSPEPVASQPNHLEAADAPFGAPDPDYGRPAPALGAGAADDSGGSSPQEDEDAEAVTPPEADTPADILY